MRLRNYFTVYLRDQEDEVKFVVIDQNKKEYLGNGFSEAGVETGKRINKSEIFTMRLFIVQYYGEVELSYKSAISFFISRFTAYAYFMLRIDRFKRLIYGSAPLARKSRIEILRFSIDNGILAEKKINVMDLLVSIHGKRLRYLNKQWPLYLYYKALLDSLEGELHRDEQTDTYAVLPKAVSTLDRFEAEERRHREAIRTQMLVAALTFVIAVTGIAPHLSSIWSVLTTHYDSFVKSMIAAFSSVLVC